MNAIDIRNLSKAFRGKRGSKIQALTDVNLQLPVGEVFGFLGPNGAGKSTTIKTIMGQIRPTAGEVAIFGESVTEAASRVRVGYLPENPSFYDFLTAREYLAFVGHAFGMQNEGVKRSTEHVLSLLKLTDAADRPIRGYSKGMVQRLGIAQALLHDPDLYVFDEPMSGLDPIGRALVKEIIKDLRRRGKTVFFSTHITSDIEVVCDRVGVIVKGKLRAVDTVKNILSAGIMGYCVQVTERDGVCREIEIEQEALMAAIEDLVRNGATVDRIEPKRRDLESFFLGLVSGGDEGEEHTN